MVFWYAIYKFLTIAIENCHIMMNFLNTIKTHINTTLGS